MDDLPQGFLQSLSRNPEAMKRFCALPEGVKEQRVAEARAAKSRAEMDALVRDL